jgi:hypothetical protein
MDPSLSYNPGFYYQKIQMEILLDHSGYCGFGNADGPNRQFTEEQRKTTASMQGSTNWTPCAPCA